MKARQEERRGKARQPDREPEEARSARAPDGDVVVEWLLGQADRALRDGRIDDALPLLERTLELARGAEALVTAHVTLGELFRHREEYGRCTGHFRAAADLAADRSDVLYQLGLAHAQQENNRAAADALRRAALLSPSDAEILRALAVALAGVGEDGEAASLLGRAQAIAPEDVRVLESLAMHHLKMGRFTECGEVVQRASALAPDNRIVRRLAKEANYLVELASAGTPHVAPEESPRRSLRLALPGAAGEVECLFVGSMARAGFTEAQRANARDAWRDYLDARPVRVRLPAEHAAAVEFLIARMDFIDGCARDQVARRHGVDDAVVARIYSDMAEALDVAVFDRRYSTQPHPVEQVSSEANRSGLDSEEVFQALLEDEFREYEESFDRSGTLLPRLGRDEFEDASVEYGSLLTREMMGLTLSKRDRVRKRELERVLLVT